MQRVSQLCALFHRETAKSCQQGVVPHSGAPVSFNPLVAGSTPARPTKPFRDLGSFLVPRQSRTLGKRRVSSTFSLDPRCCNGQMLGRELRVAVDHHPRLPPAQVLQLIAARTGLPMPRGWRSLDRMPGDGHPIPGERSRGRVRAGLASSCPAQSPWNPIGETHGGARVGGAPRCHPGVDR